MYYQQPHHHRQVTTQQPDLLDNRYLFTLYQHVLTHHRIKIVHHHALSYSVHLSHTACILCRWVANNVTMLFEKTADGLTTDHVTDPTPFDTYGRFALCHSHSPPIPLFLSHSLSLTHLIYHVTSFTSFNAPNCRLPHCLSPASPSPAIWQCSRVDLHHPRDKLWPSVGTMAIGGAAARERAAAGGGRGRAAATAATAAATAAAAAGGAGRGPQGPRIHRGDRRRSRQGTLLL